LYKRTWVSRYAPQATIPLLHKTPTTHKLLLVESNMGFFSTKLTEKYKINDLRKNNLKGQRGWKSSVRSPSLSTTSCGATGRRPGLKHPRFECGQDSEIQYGRDWSRWEDNLTQNRFVSLDSRKVEKLRLRLITTCSHELTKFAVALYLQFSSQPLSRTVELHRYPAHKYASTQYMYTNFNLISKPSPVPALSATYSDNISLIVI